jgi:hypothetical protein
MNTGKMSFRMMLLLAGLFCVLLTTGVQAADRVVVVPLCGGKPMQNVVTVAKANGMFTDPAAAMNSITNASAANPYLILIGPGQYTLTSALIMKEYVDVSGSGENDTLLTGAISSSASNETAAIVKGSKHATLSNLAVTNTGGAATAIGIYNSGLDMSAMVHQVTVTVTSGGTHNYGIYNVNTTASVMQTVNTIVKNGTTANYGVFNYLSSPIMTEVNALVSGGATNRGVNNYQSAPVMTDVNLYAWGGSGTDYGILNEYSNNVKIRRSTISGDSYGLLNSSSSGTVISQSTIVNGVSGGGYTCPGSDDNLGNLLVTSTCRL